MEMEINGVTYTLEPGADLSGGDFSGFNFLDLDLTEANFSGADCTGASFEVNIKFVKADLSNAKLLFRTTRL